jgi:hypothetical protein
MFQAVFIGWLARARSWFGWLDKTSPFSSPTRDRELIMIVILKSPEQQLAKGLYNVPWL